MRQLFLAFIVHESAHESWDVSRQVLCLSKWCFLPLHHCNWFTLFYFVSNILSVSGCGRVWHHTTMTLRHVSSGESDWEFAFQTQDFQWYGRSSCCSWRPLETSQWKSCIEPKSFFETVCVGVRKLETINTLMTILWSYRYHFVLCASKMVSTISGLSLTKHDGKERHKKRTHTEHTEDFGVKKSTHKSTSGGFEEMAPLCTSWGWGCLAHQAPKPSTKKTQLNQLNRSTIRTQVQEMLHICKRHHKIVRKVLIQSVFEALPQLCKNCRSTLCHAAPREISSAFVASEMYQTNCFLNHFSNRCENVTLRRTWKFTRNFTWKWKKNTGRAGRVVAGMPFAGRSAKLRGDSEVNRFYRAILSKNVKLWSPRKKKRDFPTLYLLYLCGCFVALYITCHFCHFC